MEISQNVLICDELLQIESNSYLGTEAISVSEFNLVLLFFVVLDISVIIQLLP
jgi:hypothetical protein